MKAKLIKMVAENLPPIDEQIFNLCEIPCRHCGKIDAIVASVRVCGRAQEQWFRGGEKGMQTDHIYYSQPKVFRCASCGKKRA